MLHGTGDERCHARRVLGMRAERPRNGHDITARVSLDSDAPDTQLRGVLWMFALHEDFIQFLHNTYGTEVANAWFQRLSSLLEAALKNYQLSSNTGLKATRAAL